MFQKSRFAIFLALIPLFAIAQPRVEFNSRSIDFGKVLEGSISTHRFNYKNIGNQPFIIDNVSVTCGCTAPQWNKNALNPGDTASVYIEFDSKNKMGPVHKGVNLMTNCEEPLIGLLIYANIIPDSAFVPLIDSLTFFPLRLILQKSFRQIRIPLKLLHKRGFKGNAKDAETLLKHILESTNHLLYDNVWITVEGDFILANMIDKNLQTPTITVIQKELLNKKKLRYWIKNPKK